MARVKQPKRSQRKPLVSESIEMESRVRSVPCCSLTGEKNRGAGSSAVSRPGAVMRQKSQESRDTRDTDGDSPQTRYKHGKAIFGSADRRSWEEFAAFSWLFSSLLLDIRRLKTNRWPLQPFWEQQMSRGPVKDFRTTLSLGSIWTVQKLQELP